MKFYIFVLIALTTMTGCLTNKTKPDPNLATVKKQFIRNNNLLAGGSKALNGTVSYVIAFEDAVTGEKTAVKDYVYKLFDDKYTYIKPGKYKVTLACFHQEYDEKEIKKSLNSSSVQLFTHTDLVTLNAGDRVRPTHRANIHGGCDIETLKLTKCDSACP